MGLLSTARDAQETRKAEATARKERDADPGQRWEYRVLWISERRGNGMLGPESMERQFNDLGRAGWELVNYSGERAVFKRAT